MKIPPLIIGGLGFALALACCLPFVRWQQSVPDTTQPQPQTPRQPSAQTLSFLDHLRDGSFAFDRMDPAQLLERASCVDALSADEREAALALLLELPEDERRTALAVLLANWAESEPDRAILWCHGQLEGVERHALIRDLATTWAHRDTMELATWWADHMIDRGTPDLENCARGVLARQDPLTCAKYMGFPCFDKTTTYGVIENTSVLDPEELPNYAKAIVGQVGYNKDQPGANPAIGEALPGKSGWNELFEKVALEWHRRSPEACEAWLKQFPEEAQAAARYRIDRAR